MVKNKNLYKKLLALLFVFLISGVHLYGDILPFGISALASLGANSLSVLAYILGVILSRSGYSSFLRHSFTPFIYMLSFRLLKKRVPAFILSGASVLLSGTISLLLLSEEKMLYFAFVVIEAIVSAVFTLVFREAKKALFEKMQGGEVNEVGFAFGVVSLMTLCLSFSDVEVGELSISSALMILIGMASSYKHKAPVSVVVNMAAGFMTFLFSPQNPSAVAYLVLAGFLASLLKSQGRFLIPFTYIFLLPFFINMNILRESFSLYDMVLASLLFMFIPGKVLDFIDIIPKVQNEEDSCQRLSERVNSVAETFLSIADIFSKMELLGEEMYVSDAADETVREVCGGCKVRGKCAREARESLKSFDKQNEFFKCENINCVNKKELFTRFSNNYQIMRMERLWQNHLKEENSAISGQMKGISKMLKGISKKEELKLKRDEAKEKEIASALKKQGINVRKISAGINKKGVFEVILTMHPCKGNLSCENIIPSVLKEVTGFELLRYGVKNCSDCRVCYTMSPKYSLDISVSEIKKEAESGDSFAFAYVDSEHFAVALSDGMGTGKRAKEKSSASVKLALRLMTLGMDIPSAVSMVNSLLLRQGGRVFATLDIALINLETGLVKYTKNAANTGFLLTCGGNVKKMSLKGNPLGIALNAQSGVGEMTLKDGDFLIMVSDGVTDSFGEKGEEELYEKINSFTGGSAKELAEYLMLEAGQKAGKNIKDDMTLIAVGCIKKQKSGNNRVKAKEKKVPILR